MLELWTAKAVRQELAFAFRVLNATTGPVGQRRLKSAYPAYEYSVSDLAEQHHAEVEARRRGETTLRSRLVARFRPSSEEIGRSHEILLGTSQVRPWIKLADAYPMHQSILVEAVLAASRGIGDRRLCRDRGYNLSTFQRYRDHAAGVIAIHLNRMGVVPWA
jgi:hypothetical protein